MKKESYDSFFLLDILADIDQWIEATNRFPVSSYPAIHIAVSAHFLKNTYLGVKWHDIERFRTLIWGTQQWNVLSYRISLIQECLGINTAGDIP